jgi:hypothetical protein
MKVGVEEDQHVCYGSVKLLCEVVSLGRLVVCNTVAQRQILMDFQVSANPQALGPLPEPSHNITKEIRLLLPS